LGSSAAPDGRSVRSATRDDIAAVDAVFAASNAALGVVPESHVGFLKWIWSQAYVDLARDTVVVEDDGDVVAFAQGIYEDSTPSVLRCLGRVAPSHVGRGIGTWLLMWFAERGEHSPRITRHRLGIAEEDEAGHRLAEAHGFVRVRSSLDMGAELAAPPEPMVPGGVTIRRLEPGEERAVWVAEAAAFRDHWDHEQEPSYETFLGEWFGDPGERTNVWVAVADGEIVGECAWIVDGDPYVISLGVVREARRRGIGTALLRTVMADAVEEGHRRISLSVDAESPTGAVHLYERAGLRVIRTLAIFERPVGAA
jgi:mycothiol synthase